jgi:hypothetical protein
MGILRITMRKTSSQSVSGAFTAPESTQVYGSKPWRVNDPNGAAIAAS